MEDDSKLTSALKKFVPHLLPLFERLGLYGELIEKFEEGEIKPWRIYSELDEIDERHDCVLDMEENSGFLVDGREVLVELARADKAPKKWISTLRDSWEKIVREAVETCKADEGAVSFLRFIEEIVEAVPGGRNELVEYLSEYSKTWLELVPKRAADTRILEGIDDEPERVQVEGMINWVGKMGQNYEGYVRLVFNLARLGTTHGIPDKFGQLTTQGRDLLNKRYPARVDLINPDFVHYRNAFRGHDSYRVTRGQVEVLDRKWGPKTLSLQDLCLIADEMSTSVHAARVAASAFLTREVFGSMLHLLPSLEEPLTVLQEAMRRGFDNDDWKMWNAIKSHVLRSDAKT